ncbi:archaea-specific SMC-related protein [Haloarchaeobius sp. DYHT-AS-18]|uniref:archaea-specific SMC-related protein n=1 Tax=Haloarchaeobius sp. DYHT-AS-18 TaxID=3446117 RepID=UPI003EC04D0A
MSERDDTTTVTVHAENVGGIDETDVEFSPGVTVLSGRNATNRTSFLQALMAALGSERASLKADASAGRVDLTIGDETYTRELRREGEGVWTGGEPYLGDPTLADLYAFLLESNEARRAVALGDDLRELIMRPVDTTEIKAEIQRLEARKRQLDERLAATQDLQEERAQLRQRQEELDAEIDEKREALRATEETIEEMDASLAEAGAETDQLEASLSELRDARGKLEDVRFHLETERESLASVTDRLVELEAEERDETAGLDEDPADIERRIDSLHDRIQSVNSTINRLQGIVEFNREMLDGQNDDVVAALDEYDGTDGGTLTDALVPDESVVCWTCGNEAERSAISETVEQLESLCKDKLEERQELDRERAELQSTLDELDAQREQREQRARERAQRQAEQGEHEERIEDLEARETALHDRIEDLEREVEALEAEEYEDILEQHREANRLQFEVDRLVDDQQEVADRIEEIDRELGEREDLESTREEVTAELTDLRTRIDRLESRAVSAFNEHMETVLELLGYENLERVWIERVERTERAGRRNVEKTAFELHVVRETADGEVYEDSVEHLSESEREVIGLVFALAGYLVHEVHETVPFVLLDSIEAIDSDRIAALVEYFESYTDYLVVALLPEDASALDETYARITDI